MFLRAAAYVLCMVLMVPCDWFCQVVGGKGQNQLNQRGSDRLSFVRESVSFLRGGIVCRAVHRGLVKWYC